ncbi:MAG: sulfatase-like hydrolase/transferase [Sphaerochaeta sp.]
MDEAEFIKLQKDYYAAITGLDDQFARIYADLKEHNLFDDTIVVLTADHGPYLSANVLHNLISAVRGSNPLEWI